MQARFEVDLDPRNRRTMCLLAATQIWRSSAARPAQVAGAHVGAHQLATGGVTLLRSLGTLSGRRRLRGSTPKLDSATLSGLSSSAKNPSSSSSSARHDGTY